MNDHQRKMARKSKKVSGYKDGGLIDRVSDAIEGTGKIFGTEKAKKIKDADEEMRRANPGNMKRHGIDGTPRRTRQLEEQERRILEGRGVRG